MNLKLSIIIATYNRRHCIGRAIDSIFQAFDAMSREAIEIIVVDDCSSDETDYFVREKYKSEIANGLIVYEKLNVNKGVCGARNHGVSRARGDWVIFFDSDDELIPNIGSRVICELEGHQKEPVIFFRCIDQNGNLVGHHFADKAKKITLNEYLIKSSYGEALTAVRTKVMLENLFTEELRGYEGYTLAKILKSLNACAVLSNLVARIYIQTGSDRLSSHSGFRRRIRLLARGHLMMVNEFSGVMPYYLIIGYVLKSVFYYAYSYVLEFVSRERFY